MKRSVWGWELPGTTVRPGGVRVGVHAEHTEDTFSALLSLMAYCTYREHSWVYTEPTLAAFFQPLHSNATKLISSPTWVSRSMPKIWTILSIYIIIAKTFCAFEAHSMSEVHSSAGQVYNNLYNCGYWIHITWILCQNMYIRMGQYFIDCIRQGYGYIKEVIWNEIRNSKTSGGLIWKGMPLNVSQYIIPSNLSGPLEMRTAEYPHSKTDNNNPTCTLTNLH